MYTVTGNVTRQQRWLFRVRQSRTDSPCVIALVACTGVLLIIFVISSALYDLFDGGSGERSKNSGNSTSLTRYSGDSDDLMQYSASNNGSDLSGGNDTVLQRICVAVAPLFTEATCVRSVMSASQSLFARHEKLDLDEFAAPIAVTPAGSVGNYVTRHIRQMLDDSTQPLVSVRIKKVSCVHVANAGDQAFCAMSVVISRSLSGGSTETVDQEQEAASVSPKTVNNFTTPNFKSKMYDDSACDDSSSSSTASGENQVVSRHIYTTLLDVNTLIPIENSGKILGIPETGGVFPSHPTVFIFNAELYVSLVAVDAATGTVRRPFLWDVLRNVRVDIRLPAFISKNLQHFFTSWVPWVVPAASHYGGSSKSKVGPAPKQKLCFVFSVLPWQAVTCEFITNRSYLFLSLLAHQEERYLNCRIDSVVPPVLPKSFLIDGKDHHVRDVSLFLPFKDDYFIGYVQLVASNNSDFNRRGQRSGEQQQQPLNMPPATTSGHIALVNEQTRKIVAFTSGIVTGRSLLFQQQSSTAVTPTAAAMMSSAKIPINTEPPPVRKSKNSHSFMLFGGISGRKGVAFRIEGMSEILDAAIGRDKQFLKTCYHLNLLKVKLFERNILTCKQQQISDSSAATSAISSTESSSTTETYSLTNKILTAASTFITGRRSFTRSTE